MKKRYIISIITIFIFALSFFAYNKLSNKQIYEDNNTIGIYLEDDYESNTYTLSDSIDIPSDGYTFNAEKTNEECPNATFSYDSVNVKVQVNSNKSVKCNMYFKEDLPQLINYQFLYDGSLGNTTANKMNSVTGGWYQSAYDFGSYAVDISFTSSYIYRDVTKYGQKSYIATQNVFDPNDYVGYYADFSAYGTQCSSSDTDSTYANIGNSECKWGGKYYGSWTVSRTKTFCKLIDSNEMINNNTGIGTGWGTKGNLYIYEMALLKEDNWQRINSLLNINEATILDLLNKYSTQILNNEKTVKYMLKQCTGEFMAKAITNQTFMTAYQSSPYKSLIDANSHWKKFIDIGAT